jgi:hypothetical protein
MIKKFIIPVLLISAVTLSNCGSGGDDPITVPITAPTITTPAVSGVDGMLVAINTRTKSSGTDVVVGTAYAAFYKNQKPATKFEAGNVVINTRSTQKSDDNIYFYSPSATEPNGIPFTSQIFWQVSGNSTNGIPAISDNDGSGFANFPTLSEFLTLSATQDYFLNWISSNGADSVILTVKGPSAVFKKTFANSVSAYTIPKAEINKLGKGSGSVEIINYKLSQKTFGGKNYAFIKQAVAYCSKVNITN